MDRARSAEPTLFVNGRACTLASVDAKRVDIKMTLYDTLGRIYSAGLRDNF